MNVSSWVLVATLLGSTVLLPGRSVAVSPAAIASGRALFERDWQSRNPSLGSDGLGPLFNAKSCVACHHQGGIGGGGDTRFNAHAIGIERIEFVSPSGTVSDMQKTRLIREFYPGLAQADGTILNSAAIHHHGGSIEFDSIRNRILHQTDGLRSEAGGPLDAEAARSVTGNSIFYDSRNDSNESHYLLIEAKLFQRNTTGLFGSGLIDKISDRDIQRQAKLQDDHAEISGRPSILVDGSIGRFGWRASAEHLINFVEQACVNELSLQTKSRRQSVDPERPDYLNPGVDISDDQVSQMRDFIASLPQPIQFNHDDPNSLGEVQRGRAAFEQVGCAVCHVPDLGPAAGIYSDILLHDMGPGLYDREAAGPHVTRMQLTTEIVEVPGTRIVAYYGSPASVTSPGSGSVPDRFVSQSGSLAETDFVPITSERLGRLPLSSGTRFVTSSEMAKSTGLRRTLKPSNTTQEWRTAPLWGVADSAPYMHDGRAATLLEAIVMHGGEATGSRDRFLNLPIDQRRAVIAFLNSLVAPPVAHAEL